jgi:hypothetical protein
VVVPASGRAERNLGRKSTVFAVEFKQVVSPVVRNGLGLQIDVQGNLRRQQAGDNPPESPAPV